MSLEITLPKRSAALVDCLTKGDCADAIMRIVAVSLGGEISTRIHEKGQKADGSQIGTYSPQYVKQRQRNKWGTSTKVILEFTGQMRQDFSVVTQNPVKIKNGYALGFTNPFNEAKAGWNEKRYGKVYALTTAEREKMRDIIEYEISRLIK